jgi:diguanylate cyclase (GGDEF)-like protein
VSQNNKALEKISTTDELTGVGSYRAFRIQLEETWREYQDSKLPISLIKLNIDYFYEFNAHYGQEVSDRQLQLVARILDDQITDSAQMVARLQGAEFAVLLPGMSAQDARQIARTIHETLADRKIEHARSACSKFLTMSLGVGSQTVMPHSFSRELLARVDTALRLAKERGHDRLEVLEA